jgi:DNA-binding MarR family transcriptional regulator
LNNEDLAQKIMMAFTNMKKHHAKYHSLADTKRSEMAILAILQSRRKENGLKITDISRLLNLPPSAITPVVGGLEEKGFVERQNSPEDRRIVLVTLTKAGSGFIEEKQALFLKKTLKLVEYLGEKDAKEFIRLLEKAFEFMNKEFENEE